MDSPGRLVLSLYSSDCTPTEDIMNVNCVQLLLLAAVVSLLSHALVEGSLLRERARATISALDSPGRNKEFGPLKHAQRVRPLAASNKLVSSDYSSDDDSSSTKQVYQIWAQLSLADWGGRTWYGNISIGTPPQPFTVAFCSYWGDSWVVGVDCDQSDVVMCNATMYHQYNSSASTYLSARESFEGPFYDDYYPGLTGSMGMDTFRVGLVGFALVHGSTL
jgi:Eukaryotic aspartyl protease